MLSQGLLGTNTTCFLFHGFTQAQSRLGVRLHATYKAYFSQLLFMRSCGTLFPLIVNKSVVVTIPTITRATRRVTNTCHRSSDLVLNFKLDNINLQLVSFFLHGRQWAAEFCAPPKTAKATDTSDMGYHDNPLLFPHGKSGQHSR